MTKSTSDADRLETAVILERTFHADDSIEFEQRERRCRIVEIHPAKLQLRDQRFGQCFSVDFQSDSQRRLRTDAWSNSAERFAFKRTMELQRISPKRFVAESVKAKRLLAFIEHVL